MRVSEIEKRTGLSRHALRYYEREGLLLGIQRKANGYRIYPDDAVAQLHLLKGMQALGFGLDEIRPILIAVNANAVNCADGARLVAEKRIAVQQQIRRLQRVSRELLKQQKKLEIRAAAHGVEPSSAALRQP